MNPFPPAHPQLPPARRPLGALTLTPDLQAAAQALVSRVNLGCVTTAFDECSAFQQAYVNAGGSITIDGLYGPHTQAALQSVLTTIDGSTAPASCFSTAVVPATPSTATSSSGNPITSFFAPGATLSLPIVGPVQTRTLVVGAAGLFAVWLVGSALWRVMKEGAVGTRPGHRSSLAYAKTVRHSALPTRRKKNPSRRRRAREKAKVRAENQDRDPKTGRFHKR